MTLDELTLKFLRRVQVGFYQTDPRGFLRDRQALVKALARYGSICAQRGWALDAEFIYADIVRVLGSFENKKDRIEYLPIYLQHAIDQHCREHAEELRRAAQAHEDRVVTRVVERVSNGVRVVEAVRTVPMVEQLDALGKTIKRSGPAKGKAKGKAKPAQGPKQEELFG